MKLSYSEYAPSSEVSSLVDRYWYWNIPEYAADEKPVQTCLPYGTMELIVHLQDSYSIGLENNTWVKHPRSMLVGIKKDPVTWTPGKSGEIFGVSFIPEHFIALFNFPVACLFNNYMDTQLLANKYISELVQLIGTAPDNETRILKTEAYLKSRLGRINKLPIIDAIYHIRKQKGDFSTESINKVMHVCERQAQRLFKDQLGLSPKAYNKIIRFRNIIDKTQHMQDARINWADIAYSSGYSDQAHLIRDFRQYTGKTPGAFFENKLMQQ